MDTNCRSACALSRARSAGKREQAIDIEMPLDVIGEFVEHLFDGGAVVLVRGSDSEPVKKGAAESVRGEQAVQIGAVYATVTRDGAFRGAADECEWTRAVRSIGPADMDFVGIHALVARGMNRLDAGEILLRRHHSCHIQKSKPGHFPRRSFDAIGIGDAVPQHLIAATEAEDMSAASMMREQVDIPALSPQEIEVAPGRFRTGKDDQRGISRDGLAWRDQDEIDVGLKLQWIEVVEIRNPRQFQECDSVPAGPALLRKPQRIFRRKFAGARKIRQDPKTSPGGSLGNHSIAIVEQRRLAAEFVDDEAADHGGVL